MDKDVIHDLKQFIEATVSQQTSIIHDDIVGLKGSMSSLNDDMSSLKKDMSSLKEDLTNKIDDLFQYQLLKL